MTEMREMKLDVRHATCQGGGALYSLLGHIREIPQGGSIELMSDDYMAPIDVPAWAEKAGWQVWQVRGPGYETFVIQRPIRA
jgi:TusA-related sulfurtransferase